ncbi:hypothetical protein TNCT_508761 [Trichonephila clavata]|uniref:Uncharacterized protein n=1 Tax=Trichonephila clavata TaxID=2740835 RepID=A0A8X6K1E4_TRICU|nr:hypothetical protein TNCT_508761 [Trichonephila clavata]
MIDSGASVFARLVRRISTLGQRLDGRSGLPPTISKNQAFLSTFHFFFRQSFQNDIPELKGLKKISGKTMVANKKGKIFTGLEKVQSL